VRKENREGEVPHSLFTWHMPKLSLVWHQPMRTCLGYHYQKILIVVTRINLGLPDWRIKPGSAGQSTTSWLASSSGTRTIEGLDQLIPSCVPEDLLPGLTSSVYRALS
jgi:hypothetical protein